MTGEHEPLSRDELDLLNGMAHDAIGQAGGVDRDDQRRLGELVLRAAVGVWRLRQARGRLGADELRRIQVDAEDYGTASGGGRAARYTPTCAMNAA